MNEKDIKKYFLPYQERWLKDGSQIKIWEKSRRIGATYVQSYEDVRDCAGKKVPAVWFSSADESAAREYIEYCEKWTRLFHVAGKYLGQVLLDSEKDIKAFVIEYANGTKIHALSSNPKAFRSKGGKVVLDEFAWHDDQDKMWSAARPCITWGFPMRILSTHNGTNSRFYKFIKAIKQGRLNWSLHTTDIFKAVDDGLVDKILGRKATEEEKQAWIKEQRDNCFDENTWRQEYCCEAVDEASAFLTYEMITNCEDETNNILMPLEEIQGDIFVGVDIGRKRDLTVIWVIEKLGRVKYTRMVKVLEKTQFHIQREVLFEILRHNKMRRCCIDSTGLGMQLAEEAQIAFGRYRVEAVTFTAKVKEELAFHLRTQFEDRTIYIPSDYVIREDLHSVRKVTTTAGNIRFDVLSSERLDSHADRFWALALALHAASEEGGPIYVTSRHRREAMEIVRGY